MRNTVICSVFAIILSNFSFALPPTKGAAPQKADAEVINSTTVKLTWEGSVKAYAYRLRSRESGILNWSYYTIVAPTSVRRLSNLRAGTKYEWQIQTMFSESKHDTSRFVNGPSFITFSNCDKPENLEASIISSSKVMLRWEFMNDNAMYEVKLKTLEDSTWITYNTSANNLVIDNLSPSKKYEWEMTVHCDGNMYGAHSETSDTGVFITAGGNIAPEKINSYENNSWQSNNDINYITFFQGSNNNEANNKASLINSVGQVISLPMYYNSTNGEITFDIDQSMPAGIYNVKYINGKTLFNRTILIAGN